MRTHTVSPNPDHSSPDELEAAMRAAPNQRSFVRLSVIRALLLGHPRSTVCQLYCRTDRMVRLWITSKNGLKHSFPEMIFGNRSNFRSNYYESSQRLARFSHY